MLQSIVGGKLQRRARRTSPAATTSREPSRTAAPKRLAVDVDEGKMCNLTDAMHGQAGVNV